MRVEFEKCIIRAPMTGIITHRYAKLGTSIINSGLAAGDRVILAPPAELKVGDLVQVR